MSKCQCTFSIKMLGDGCRYCQPQEYIDRLVDWYEQDIYELKEIMYVAIKAGDWKVDGACDPSELLEDFKPSDDRVSM